MTHPHRLLPDRVSLFLDVDGTLAQIRPRPEDVGPDVRRNTLLRRVARAVDGRLAILSGRTIPEVDYILDNAVRAVAGVHGLERRDTEGERRDYLITDEVRQALDQAILVLNALAEQKRGVLIEAKGKSVGVHYRLNPEAEDMVLTITQNIAQNSPLSLQRGDRVAELRAPGPDKGDALRAFMNEVPFEGRMPVFVGDDLTDEHAFRAAVELGGFGVLVGPERETLARYNLPNVAAVLDWLEDGVAHHA
ncbi:trehalose-phosphatase [Asticcacaulis sp. BYS171W]|uniref:Trehalose 6-phosphate phosphatase n=1 Tax=Asticcacaulis aquaticus TaxID=2984212 RepID=A0ABT5HY53_9CAUL|nr:trehalose-phosphatase [Asticcacaulis aquaticus]MDC7684847.1 trehalose-phosphatase [Asticcacaulis aquaticus]